jgi:SAM-dependent methyltransferase
LIEKQPGEGGLACLGYEVVRDGQLVRVTRVNIGSGHSRFIDCVNLDASEVVGADVICNVEGPDQMGCFQSDTFSSVYCSHVIEHLDNPLRFMQELSRICCHGALACFKLPYGSSDNAWEDPTHKRPYFLDSFGYFSQAAYAGADYGYRGDWTAVKRRLTIKSGRGFEHFKNDLEALMAIVMVQRNVVDEMTVFVRNVKPIRDPATAREACPIEFQFQGEAQGPDVVRPLDETPQREGSKPS